MAENRLFRLAGVLTDAITKQDPVLADDVERIFETWFTAPTFDNVQGDDGSAAAPTYSFTDDPDIGMYRIGTNSLGFSSGGVERIQLDNNGLEVAPVIKAQDGSAAAPGYSFTDDPDTGIYSAGDDSLGLSIGGVVRRTITTGSETATLVQLGPAGAAAAPTYSFSTDPNTGVYSVGADSFGVTVGGVVRRTITTGSETATLVQLGPAGSVSAPSYSFSGDTDTGIYSDAANSVSVATAGTQRLDIDSGGIKGKVSFLGPAGSAAAPGLSFDADTDTGIYSDAANSMSFATSGTQRLDIDSGGIKGKVAFQAPYGSAGAPGVAFDGDSDTGMYRLSANRLGFSCGGAFRMLVDPSGLVTMRNSTDVGTGSAVASIMQIGVSGDATNPGTNDYWSMFRRGDGITVGSIRGTGSASVNYLTTSDATLKTDNGIVTSERVGGIIDGLEVHDFDWIDGDVSDQIGLFAQQAIDILPDTIVTPPGVEPGDDDEPERYLAASLDYSKIVPILIAECQFLRQRLSALESQS